MATATTLGPIEINQINTVFYVGGSDGCFPTMQAAVDYVKKYNAGVGEIILLQGYTGSEDAATLTNGADGIYISDQRNAQYQNWEWDSGLGHFSPADIEQLGKLTVESLEVLTTAQVDGLLTANTLATLGDANVGGMASAYGFSPPDYSRSNFSAGTGSLPDVAPGWALINAAAPTDQRLWAFFAVPDQLLFSTEADSGIDNFWLRAYRSGNAVTNLIIYPPTDFPGGLTSAGSPVRTFANTPDSGGGGGGGTGGVNPGTAGQMAFYSATGPLVSGSLILSDSHNLFVPGLVKASGFNPPDLSATNTTIGTGGGGAIPVLTLINASAPVDQRMWVTAALTDKLIFSAEADTGADYYWMQALRTGHTVTKVIITPPVDVTGVLTSQGSPVRTFANTPTGGGANPGSTGQVSFYPAVGTTVSPTQIMTDTATQSTLYVPNMITSAHADTNYANFGNHAVADADGGNYIQEHTTSVMGGSGFNYGGPWTVIQHGYDTMYQNVRGIAQMRVGFIERHAVGDTMGLYYYVKSDGGVAAGADEGCSGCSVHVLENLTYFHGTVNTTTGTGDQAPTWTWTDAGPGSNHTTDGAYMLNISKGQLSGNWNGPSTPVYLDTGAGPAATYLNQLPITNVVAIGPVWNSTRTYATGEVVTFTGNNYVSLVSGNLNHNPASSTAQWALLPTGQLPLSTAVGVMVDASIPASYTAANNPVSRTLVFNLVKIGTSYPPFAVGDVISVAAEYQPEQSIITAVVNPGDPGGTGLLATQQKLTMKLRNPHGATILFKGGLAGQYISMDANLAFSGMRSSYYAFGSLDGTNLIYGYNVTGSLTGRILPMTGCEAATSSGANSGFHLFPGAEVVCNPNFDYSGTLEQNGVHWEAGDVVENPHYPAYGGVGILLNKTQVSPTPAGYGSIGLSLGFDGPGWCGSAQAILIRHNLPLAHFADYGGPVTPPGGIEMSGFHAYGLAMNPPAQSGACLSVEASGDPSFNPNLVVHMLRVHYAGGGDLNFDPTLARWSFTGGLLVNQLISQTTVICGAGANFFSGTHSTSIDATNNFVELVFDVGGDGNKQRIAAYKGGFPLDSNIYYDTITIGPDVGSHIFRWAWYGGTPTEAGRFDNTGLHVTGAITATTDITATAAVEAPEIHAYTTAPTGVGVVRFQAGGPTNAYALATWGTGSSPGLANIFGLFDGTRSALVWNINSSGDMFFNAPLSAGNSGAGAVAKIFATGLIDGTAFSVGGVAGVNGTLTIGTQTVTVTKGLITAIV